MLREAIFDRVHLNYSFIVYLLLQIWHCP